MLRSPQFRHWKFVTFLDKILFELQKSFGLRSCHLYKFICIARAFQSLESVEYVLFNAFLYKYNIIAAGKSIRSYLKMEKINHELLENSWYDWLKIWLIFLLYLAATGSNLCQSSQSYPKQSFCLANSNQIS